MTDSSATNCYVSTVSTIGKFSHGVWLCLPSAKEEACRIPCQHCSARRALHNAVSYQEHRKQHTHTHTLKHTSCLMIILPHQFSIPSDTVHTHLFFEQPSKLSGHLLILRCLIRSNASSRRASRCTTAIPRNAVVIHPSP